MTSQDAVSQIFPLALTIAGSDSCGGAGVQADQRTFHAFGVRAATAITALTAQNPAEILGISLVDPAFVALQARAVLDHERVAAVKTGMLGSAGMIEAISGLLARLPARPPLVVDPVMAATSGASLLSRDAVGSLIARLLPLADLVTPNLLEAAMLLRRDPSEASRWSREEQAQAAERILAMGPAAVLVKGGHRADAALDILAWSGGLTSFEAARVPARSTHGTGCTLAAAIAAGLALEWDMIEAIRQAKEHVTRALALGLDRPLVAALTGQAAVRIEGAS